MVKSFFAVQRIIKEDVDAALMEAYSVSSEINS